MLNGDQLQAGQSEPHLPRDPNYTLSEEGWKKVLVPLVLARDWGSFLVQATILHQAADRRREGIRGVNPMSGHQNIPSGRAPTAAPEDV